MLVGLGTGILGFALGALVGAAGDDDDGVTAQADDTRPTETTETSDGDAGDDSTTTESDESTTTGEASEEGTREDPLPIGTQVETDEGWSITVNSVNFDAGTLIAAENQFNEPAPAGSRYVLVNATVTNNSDEPGDPLFSVSLGMIGSQNRMWDGANASCSAVYPEPMFDSGELFTGGTFTGNECLVIPDAEVADGSLLVAVSSTFGDPVFVQSA